MTTLLIAETLPQQLMRRDSERLRRYQQHLDFYQGRQWLGPHASDGSPSTTPKS